ncbi:MAG: AbrB/MazE/SpoVT family DNA-binding domain-containing protein [Promethearchaeota archaeon]
MNYVLSSMIYGKLSKRGQVVIPKKIRDLTNIEPGDTIKFSIKENRIILEKIDPIEEDSIVEFLKKGEFFEKDLVHRLRSEWD